MHSPTSRRDGSRSTRHALLVGLAFAASTVAPSLLLAEAGEAPQYTMREERPRTGSNLRRETLSATLPLNRRYEDLAAEDKRRFHASYELLGPGDEPPFPADGLGAIYTPLHKAIPLLRDARGVLEAIVYVDASGRASQVEILSSPAPELSKLAALVGMETRFKPAKCGGTACPMGFPIKLRIARGF